MARKILIVDDQDDILLILEREFRRMPGVIVMTAGTRAEALTLIGKKEIDLVICDVRIGPDSGFDLARDIKRERPRIGIILMSAYRSSTNRQQAEELGVIVFLEKPFPVPRLIQEVEAYFQRMEIPIQVEESAQPAATNKSSALVHFKLQDLVQLFCLNGRNILITIDPKNGGPSGEIYIQQGRVIHAEHGGSKGDAGFHELMLIPNPALRVKDWTAPVPVTIQTKWEHLLLQSAINSDQNSARLAQGLG